MSKSSSQNPRSPRPHTPYHRWPAATKAALLTTFRTSGPSALAFAGMTGVPLATFAIWQRAANPFCRAGACGRRARRSPPASTSSTWRTCTCTTVRSLGPTMADASRDRGRDRGRICGRHCHGFQYQQDAERCLAAWRARLAKFGLALHPDKTRLLEFGRFAATQRKTARGEEAGDLRLPWIHAYLREDPNERPLLCGT